MSLARSATQKRAEEKPQRDFVRTTIRAFAAKAGELAAKYPPMFLFFVGLSMATFILELVESRVSLEWYALLAFVGVSAVALDVLATRGNDER